MTRRILLAALAALLAPAAPASPPPGARTDPFVERLIHGRPAHAGGQRRPPGRDDLRLLARFLALDLGADPPRLRVWMGLGPGGEAAARTAGAAIHARLGSLASASVPLPRLAALARAPGVEWIAATRRLRAELDVSLPEMRADIAADVYGARGAGVIVGIVDEGIDIFHDDFRNPDGSTRIKALWNQPLICGNQPPPPLDYGCLYTEAQINDALEGMGTVVANDFEGHGGHVAGIAAGNGRATGNGQPAGTYVGMASEADLIVVKATVDLVQCSNCDAGDALMFIDQQAGALGMPWVANMSLGGDFGGHDGTDAVELVIDSLTGPGVPGKAVVKSAGNTRGFAIHISGTVPAGGTNVHTFTVPDYTPIPGPGDDASLFSLFHDAGDTFRLTLAGPSGVDVVFNSGDVFASFGTPDGAILMDESFSPTPGGTPFIDVLIDDFCSVVRPQCGNQVFPAPVSGTWTLEVRGNTIAAGGDYDAWIWFSSLGASQDFVDWDSPDPGTLLTVPGTSHHVTSVAGYVSREDWVDESGTPRSLPDVPGEIGIFSSPGPTRDGRIKPEVAAPGQMVASSLGGGASVPATDIVEDGEHFVLRGTSMAAPHVTGLYARMLSLNPALDAAQLRTMLQESARTDAFTGAVPNADWGAGKADALGAVEMVIKPIANLRFETATRYAWDDGAPHADTYNVYRAKISQLDGAFYGNCRAQGLGATELSEGLAPPLGDGFFYLVTGVKDGIEGFRGKRGDGTLRTNQNTCS